MTNVENKQHFEDKIPEIKMNPQQISDYKESLNSLVSLEKNQRVFDFVLSDIKANITTLSACTPEEKKLLANFLLTLWKMDKENDHINRDDSVYKDLIYQLFDWKITDKQKLEESSKEYEQISSFAEELGTLYMDFLDKWKSWSNSGLTNFYQSTNLESFKQKYPQYISYINDFAQNINWEKSMKDFFKKINNEVKISFDKYSLEDKKYTEQTSQKNIDQSIISNIAQLQWVNQTVENKINYTKIRNDAEETISKIENQISKMHPLAQTSMQKWINKFKIDLKNTPDAELVSFITKSLNNVQSQINTAPIDVKWKSDIDNVLETAIKETNSITAAKLSPEKQSSISWKSILESDNQKPDSFKQFVEKEQYKQVYNDIFDMMYLLKIEKKGFTPWEITFRGEKIAITQQHINTFKLILRSQLNDNTPDFSKLDLSYARSSDTGKISHYQDGTRVVSLPCTKPWSEKTITWYITFGDPNKDLAQWLEKTPSLSTLFDDVKEENPWDYMDVVWKMKLDGHWGSEGLRYLFQKRPQEILSYLKTWENLKTFLNKINATKEVIIDKSTELLADDTTKEENKETKKISIYPESEKNDYIKILIEWISWDKELLRTYLGEIELGEIKSGEIKTNSNFLWVDFMTKQIVTEKLFSLTTWNTPFIDKDSELFTKIITLKDIIAIQKATIDIQKEWIDKPKTLEDQIKSVVWILFQHPIGKMLMKFLDSLFGGKGGLLKKFGKIPWFSDVLNNEFVKQYGFDADQKKVLEGFKFIQNNSTTIQLDDKNIIDNLKTISATFKQENNKESIIENFEVNSVINTKLLDANLLSSYYLANKDKLKVIPYESLFVVDTVTSQPLIKENVDQGSIGILLKSIIEDTNTHKIIIDSDSKLKSGYKNTETLFDKDLFGITNQFDYAKAITAYLMGGSKWNGNFHYVLSENDVSWQPKVVESATPDVDKEAKDKFDWVKNWLKDNLKDVSDKYGNYEFKKIDDLYTYDSSETDTPISKYQKGVLAPMSQLFDFDKGQWVIKSNFNMLLESITTETTIATLDFIKDPMHFRNMLVYLQWKDASKITLWDKVLDNIKNMTKMKVDNGILVFSHDTSNTIKVSFADSKLKVDYEAKKTS